MAQETHQFRTWLLMCGAVWFGVIAAGGCGTAPPVVSARGSIRPASVVVADTQRAVEEFADRYVTTMADAYDKVREIAPTPESALLANRLKLGIGVGAINNATSPNPLAGLMNMAVLVRLTRATTEDAWAREAFGEQGVSIILAAVKPYEDDIWSILSGRLTPEQVAELQRLISKWCQEHPGERYIAGARVEAFMQADQAASRSSRVPSSVYDLFGLDPLAGLDPAIREVEQSRMMAERLFFYTRHASVLLSWQAEMLYQKALAAPEVKQVLADVERVSNATKEFANAGSQVANTVERFRADLAAQQATLVEQLDGLVARQREAALKQADEVIASQRDAALKQVAAELAVERNAAIEQLSTTVSAQQALLTENLRGVAESVIDRVYARARTLILLLAGVVVGVIAIYGFVVTPLRKAVALRVIGRNRPL